jgi:class 3 adenylate cyclase
MEQVAEPGAIVITPEALALVEGYVEVKSLGLVPVKGLADALEVFEVTGAGPHPPACGRPARADPLRGPRGRAGTAPPRP